MFPTADEILSLMANGWELGKSTTGRAWIQKGGVGHGGEAKKVHASTMRSLLDKGLVELFKPGFPTARYRLKYPIPE
jgi:hypothetical protein